jgi:hypothetical protein
VGSFGTEELIETLG